MIRAAQILFLCAAMRCAAGHIRTEQCILDYERQNQPVNRLSQEYPLTWAQAQAGCAAAHSERTLLQFLDGLSAAERSLCAAGELVPYGAYAGIDTWPYKPQDVFRTPGIEKMDESELTQLESRPQVAGVVVGAMNLTNDRWSLVPWTTLFNCTLCQLPKIGRLDRLDQPLQSTTINDIEDGLNGLVFRVVLLDKSQSAGEERNMSFSSNQLTSFESMLVDLYDLPDTSASFKRAAVNAAGDVELHFRLSVGGDEKGIFARIAAMDKHIGETLSRSYEVTDVSMISPCPLEDFEAGYEPLSREVEQYMELDRDKRVFYDNMFQICVSPATQLVSRRQCVWDAAAGALAWTPRTHWTARWGNCSDDLYQGVDSIAKPLLASRLLAQLAAQPPEPHVNCARLDDLAEAFDNVVFRINDLSATLLPPLYALLGRTVLEPDDPYCVVDKERLHLVVAPLGGLDPVVGFKVPKTWIEFVASAGSRRPFIVHADMAQGNQGSLPGDAQGVPEHDSSNDNYGEIGADGDNNFRLVNSTGGPNIDYGTQDSSSTEYQFNASNFDYGDAEADVDTLVDSNGLSNSDNSFLGSSSTAYQFNASNFDYGDTEADVDTLDNSTGLSNSDNSFLDSSSTAYQFNASNFDYGELDANDTYATYKDISSEFHPDDASGLAVFPEPNVPPDHGPNTTASNPDSNYDTYNASNENTFVAHGVVADVCIPMRQAVDSADLTTLFAVTLSADLVAPFQQLAVAMVTRKIYCFDCRDTTSAYERVVHVRLEAADAAAADIYLDGDSYYLDIIHQKDNTSWINERKYRQLTTCVAWNAATAAWSALPCRLRKALQSSLTVCRCRVKHMTLDNDTLTGSFALKLRIDALSALGDEFEDLSATLFQYATANNVLIALTVFECVVSGCGLLSFALTAICNRQWREDTGHKILLHMVSALTCNLVLGFLTDYMHFDTESTGCIVIGVLRHYSFLVMFLWMLVLSGLQMKRLMTVAGAKATTHLILKVAVFAWGAPLAPIFILLAYNARLYRSDRYDRGYCYPEGLVFQMTVQAPAAAILAINLVIFVAIVAHIFECSGGEKIQKHSKNEKAQQMRRFTTSVFIFFLFGFTWVLHYLSEERLIKSDFLFEYLFLLTATTHITMLALFFVVLDKKVRIFWLECFGGLKKRFCCS